MRAVIVVDVAIIYIAIIASHRPPHTITLIDSNRHSKVLLNSKPGRFIIVQLKRTQSSLVFTKQTLFYFNHLMFMLSGMVYRLRAQSFVCLFCVCTSLRKWSMTLLVIQLPIKYFTRVTSLDSLASCIDIRSYIRWRMRCQRSAWHPDENWQVFTAHVHITDEWMTTATKGRVMHEYERSKSLWRM